MDQIPSILYADEDYTTWLILGASRGIGLEFVRQLLSKNERIIATVREPFAAHASALWGQAGGDHGRCRMEICDVLSEESIIVCAAHLLFLVMLLVSSYAGCGYTCTRLTEFNAEIRIDPHHHTELEDRLCSFECWSAPIPECKARHAYTLN